MVQARGRRAQLLLDFESTFGQTPGTPAAIRMPANSFPIRVNRSLIEDTTLRNRRDPAMPSRGNKDVSGQVVAPVDVIGFGYWLKAMFGDPVTTDLGAGAGPYEHEFKPGDVQPSLVLEKGYVDIGEYELLNGCKVSQLAISFGGDGELTANIDIMGAERTVGDSSFDASASDVAITKFTQSQLTMQEGGSDIAIITTADLNINFNLDGDQYAIGSGGVRHDIPEGIMQVSGTLRAFFKDAVLLNKAIDGTETSLKFTLTSGDDKLEFLLPEVMFEETSPAVEGPQGILLELPYRAYYADSAEGASIIATLTNTQATY